MVFYGMYRICRRLGGPEPEWRAVGGVAALLTINLISAGLLLGWPMFTPVRDSLAVVGVTAFVFFLLAGHIVFLRSHRWVRVVEHGDAQVGRRKVASIWADAFYLIGSVVAFAAALARVWPER